MQDNKNIENKYEEPCGQHSHCCHMSANGGLHRDCVTGEMVQGCYHHHKDGLPQSAKQPCDCSEHEHECHEHDCHEHGCHEGHNHGECCSHTHTHEAAGCDCCGGSHSAGCDCCGGHKEGKRTLVISLAVLCVSLVALILSFLDFARITGLRFFHFVNVGWVAVLLCGVPIYRNAVRALAGKKITAAVLISVAITASIVLEIISLARPQMMNVHGHGYVFAAGEVAFLMKLGGMIEDFTVSKSRSGIQKMMQLAPDSAEVMAGGTTVSKPLAEVQVGDVVLCRAGSRIPVDGTVVAGSSAVDEAAITGESVPCEKSVGDGVWCGTFNTSGALQIKVTSTREDMVITKLVRLMKEAEGKRAPIARLADRWAGVIVPAAIALAIIVGIICGFTVGWQEGLVRAVTVLVVFCPCSLALATPTAIAAGIGRSAANGVMIKNGAALEVLAKVNRVYFDKTGTLTKGQLSVQNAVSDVMSGDELLALAAAAEAFSEHPVAKAIVQAGGVSALAAEDVQTQAGVGVSATVGGSKVEIVALHRAEGFDAYLDRAEAESEGGKTVVCCYKDGAPVGYISLSDTVKEDAAQCMAQLKALGIDGVMLTGDGKAAAEAVAAGTGVSDYRYSLLPQDKQAIISESMHQGNVCCMVGDGINDAPSLATADCGISVAGLGSDIAVESSDVALMDANVAKVPFIIRLSRRVLGTIKANIIAAMTINVVAVVLSALGILNPASGALVHNCTSIVVVTNSALILTSLKGGKTKRPSRQ